LFDFQPKTSGAGTGSSRIRLDSKSDPNIGWYSERRKTFVSRQHRRIL